MRFPAFATILLLAGCTMAIDPIDPNESTGPGGSNRVTVLGAIKGYNNDDPRIALAVNGRDVTVTVSTYGGGCHSKGVTDVQRTGMQALLTPWDHTAPPGTPCTMQLVEMRHTATVSFPQAGTATIRVRGIDAGTRHVGNMAGDTIIVERTVTLQ